MARKPTLVVSSPAIAYELLEQNSSIFSSRPRFPVWGELYNKMTGIVSQPYGKEWTNRRRLLSHALKPTVVRTYEKRLEAEATRLMGDFADNGGEWRICFQRFVASVSFCTAYGRSITSLESKVVKQKMEQILYFGQLAVPGKYLAETFPFLNRIPSFLAPWKREVERRGDEESALNMQLVEQVRSDLKSGKKVGESLTRTMLEMGDKAERLVSPRVFAQVPGAVFLAGVDTMTASLSTCLLALLIHPDVVALAQAEIDTVIGASRSPVLADEPNLPYITALAKEVLRWRPAAVFGTPHASTADFVYRGYLIPKGATVFASNYTISKNEEYFPCPELFDPARFVGPTDKRYKEHLHGKEHPHGVGHNAFGWGRRSCPGEGLATNTLFLAVAKTLWAFDLERVEGETYDADDYVGGVVVRPRGYKCFLRVRDAERKEVLERERAMAEDFMADFPPYE